MLEHIVLFKPKPETTEDQEKQLVQRLMDLAEHIPQIVQISAGKSLTVRSKGYTVGLVVRFNNEADLNIYRVHPKHQEVVEEVKKLCEDTLALDYIF